MIKLQKQEMEEGRASALWNECTKHSETHFSLKDRQSNHRLIRNVARRLRELETKIDIGEEDSVVEDADLT